MKVYPIKSAKIAIEVKRIDWRSHKYEVVPESLCVIKAGTLVTERPEAIILDESGKTISASGKFLWSAETIGPIHLVVDVPKHFAG